MKVCSLVDKVSQIIFYSLEPYQNDLSPARVSPAFFLSGETPDITSKSDR